MKLIELHIGLDWLYFNSKYCLVVIKKWWKYIIQEKKTQKNDKSSFFYNNPWLFYNVFGIGRETIHFLTENVQNRPNRHKKYHKMSYYDNFNFVLDTRE